MNISSEVSLKSDWFEIDYSDSFKVTLGDDVKTIIINYIVGVAAFIWVNFDCLLIFRIYYVYRLYTSASCQIYLELTIKWIIISINRNLIW